MQAELQPKAGEPDREDPARGPDAELEGGTTPAHYTLRDAFGAPSKR
jgi:hypothetical protein